LARPLPTEFPTHAAQGRFFLGPGEGAGPGFRATFVWAVRIEKQAGPPRRELPGSRAKSLASFFHDPPLQHSLPGGGTASLLLTQVRPPGGVRGVPSRELSPPCIRGGDPSFYHRLHRKFSRFTGGPRGPASLTPLLAARTLKRIFTQSEAGGFLSFDFTQFLAVSGRLHPRCPGPHWGRATRLGFAVLLLSLLAQQHVSRNQVAQEAVYVCARFQDIFSLCKPNQEPPHPWDSCFRKVRNSLFF